MNCHEKNRPAFRRICRKPSKPHQQSHSLDLCTIDFLVHSGFLIAHSCATFLHSLLWSNQFGFFGSAAFGDDFLFQIILANCLNDDSYHAINGTFRVFHQCSIRASIVDGFSCGFCNFLDWSVLRP